MTWILLHPINRCEDAIEYLETFHVHLETCCASHLAWLKLAQNIILTTDPAIKPILYLQFISDLLIVWLFITF